MARKKTAPSIEVALTELQTLVEQLESGSLPLEEALKHFEQGIQLIQQCQTTLNTAEQRVQTLLTQAGPSSANTSKA